MRPRSWIVSMIVILSLGGAGQALGQPKASGRAEAPTGTLTVAVATFGNERWLPHLYVGAEDVVLKPMYENLLSPAIPRPASFPRCWPSAGRWPTAAAPGRSIFARACSSTA